MHYRHTTNSCVLDCKERVVFSYNESLFSPGNDNDVFICCAGQKACNLSHTKSQDVGSHWAIQTKSGLNVTVCKTSWICNIWKTLIPAIKMCSRGWLSLVVAMSISLIVCPNWLIAGFAQMVKVLVFNHKMIFVRDIIKFLNLKGHQNCIIGSKVTDICQTWFLRVLILSFTNSQKLNKLRTKRFSKLITGH